MAGDDTEPENTADEQPAAETTSPRVTSTREDREADDSTTSESLSPTWSAKTKYIMAVALTIAALCVLYLSRNVLAVAALAGLIAFLVAPLIRFLHVRLRLPRGLALLISYVGVFFGLLVLGFVMVDGVVGAVSEIDVGAAEASLRSTATDTLEAVREFTIAGYTVDLTDTVDPLLKDLKQSPDKSSDKSSTTDSSSTDKSASTSGDSKSSTADTSSDSKASSTSEEEKRLSLSSDQLHSLFGGITSSVGTIGSTILAAFMSGIITVLVAIYLNADSAKFREGLKRTVPHEHRGDAEKLGNRTIRIWRGYLYGQVLNSLAVGFLMWIALMLIGLPGAFVFAVILGVLNMIPTFGPILAAIPAVLAALALGSTRLDWGHLTFALLVAVLYIVVVQVQANVMAPLITGRAVRLSPATVIIGLLVGVQVGGLVGAMLVVPVIATGKEYGRYVIAKLSDVDPFPPEDQADDPPPDPERSDPVTSQA